MTMNRPSRSKFRSVPGRFRGSPWRSRQCLDALEIEAPANCRLADEYEKAQARG